MKSTWARRIEAKERQRKEALELAEALIAAEQRGRDEILREVAKVVHPSEVYGIHGFRVEGSADVLWEEDIYSCRWCRWSTTVKRGSVEPPHPDNGCLWPRAQAAAKEDR